MSELGVLKKTINTNTNKDTTATTTLALRRRNQLGTRVTRTQLEPVPTKVRGKLALACVVVRRVVKLCKKV